MSKYRTIVADPPWQIGDFPANLHAQGMGVTPCPYPTMSVERIAALPVADLAAVEAHLYLWTTAGFLRDAYGVAEAWGFEPMYPLLWCKAPKGRGLGGKFQSNVEFVLFCRDREGACRITSRLADAADAAGITRADIDREMGTSDMAGWWLSRLPHRSKVPTWEQWQQLRDLVPIGDEFDDEIQAADEERRSDRRCNTRWFQWPRGPHSAKPEAFLDIVEQVSPGPYLEMFARRARFGWDYYGNESLGTAEVAA
jgi:N6-adenosine-specific RNA methylase IME4